MPLFLMRRFHADSRSFFEGSSGKFEIEGRARCVVGEQKREVLPAGKICVQPAIHLRFNSAALNPSKPLPFLRNP